MKALRLVPFVLVPLLALGACNSGGGPADDASSAATAPAATAGQGLTGTVLETMNSGGYTYVNVDLGGRTIWAAGPPVQVSAGDTVTIGQSMEMRDYHSKSLDRTFAAILFAGSLQVAGAGGAMPANPHNGGPKPAGPVEVGNVERAAGGQTVAEVWSGRTDLAGKEVVIRGKVVKWNAGIMGTNWLHIQDGSGAAGDGTNDLTVTTDGTAAVGDTVVVRGLLTVDKDFGAGYSYAAIIEKAAVTIE